uniref:Uncharacterized protein n=1 Tax=Cannabis sativa TaxID=3483 RepID=A0A803P4X9_CANSA
MAFFSKLGNILRQSATKQISSEVSPFKLSMSQAQELLLIVTLVDPEDLDLSLSLLVKRHPVLSRLWMDSFGSGGSYGASSGASYGGNSVDYGNNTGSYNAAAGAPSTDNFSGSFGGSGNFGGGYDASTGSSGNAGGDDSFGDNKPDAPLEGSYRDDDDTNDFAKRA